MLWHTDKLSNKSEFMHCYFFKIHLFYLKGIWQRSSKTQKEIFHPLIPIKRDLPSADSLSKWLQCPWLDRPETRSQGLLSSLTLADTGTPKYLVHPSQLSQAQWQRTARKWCSQESNCAYTGSQYLGWKLSLSHHGINPSLLFLYNI